MHSLTTTPTRKSSSNKHITYPTDPFFKLQCSIISILSFSQSLNYFTPLHSKNNLSVINFLIHIKQSLTYHTAETWWAYILFSKYYNKGPCTSKCDTFISVLRGMYKRKRLCLMCSRIIIKAGSEFWVAQTHPNIGCPPIIKY